MSPRPVRRLVVVPALVAPLILAAAGCGSSGNGSAPKSSPPATSSPSASSSMSGTAAACRKIEATLAQAPSTLGRLALHPATAKAAVTKFTSTLKQEAAAAGNPALSAAVSDFASAVQKALTSLSSNPSSVNSLISSLTKDSQKITNACAPAAG